ncbi:hypothetical protein ApAK_02340 [Thermoplasmatales archaeon AK]|nr:hypothetical protein [Thermoplasmatales archaeon AK]
MRNGRQYRKAITGKRNVYVNGSRVTNIPEHPAFAGIIRTLSKMYDAASSNPEVFQYRTPWGTTGNRFYMIPRSMEDQVSRRKAIEKVASMTAGFVGRSPDHVAGFLAGFAGNPSVFQDKRADFPGNVTRFYRKAVDEDLYVTYAIIPPQSDKQKPAHLRENEFAQVGVLSEDRNGIIVRGAQMLATGGAVSDYIFVSCIPPLKEGDEKYALSFVVPVDSDGLKLYCRYPYALGKPSVFDYPFSTMFDETDAFVVFDDVFIPWENVFVYKNIKLTQAQFFETAAHVLGNNQAQIRLAVKMKFLAGLGLRISQMNNVDKIPSVVEKLGEIASIASIVEALVLASEYTGKVKPVDVYAPNPRFLYGAMGLQAELYSRVLHTLRDFSGAGVLQLPSTYNDLLSEDTRRDIEKYITSPGFGSEQRIKLFKLAWDVIGSEFGGRHYQYEMFYAGAPYVAKNYAYRNYGFEEGSEILDGILKSYGIHTTLKEGN